MVLPTGVSPRLGQAFRQRFSPPGESRYACKLQLSAAMYAQMYAQSLGSAVGVVVAVIITTNEQAIDQLIHERPAEHGIGDEIHIVANT